MVKIWSREHLRDQPEKKKDENRTPYTSHKDDSDLKL